jgi:hypothetical protein
LAGALELDGDRVGRRDDVVAGMKRVDVDWEVDAVFGIVVLVETNV